MLFNSYVFILAFLPLCIIGYALVGAAAGRRASLLFLVAASLFFYAWWNPPYVLLIAASIGFNFSVGVILRKSVTARSAGSPTRGRAVLTCGVAANLALLGYYKYANFFVTTVNYAAGTHVVLGHIFLPLAVSFFTFTQISYLVDIYKGEPADYDLIDYCLFVVFFPHLIAGPVVRHHEILPQIRDSDGRFHFDRLPAGLTLFSFGLFSKVVLADSIAPYGVAVFAAVEHGASPQLFQAWGGALAYTCQLYFDFSGYSTMALGLGYLFDIKMPLNFNSPYKANSAVDFWRRWHMSLSRFLRDYLYIPLGGNRKGSVRRYANLLITMLLGGLWHGAGWTFIIWGGMHGLYLVINHAWSKLTRQSRWANSRPMRAGYYVITFLAVVAGWVVFRSASLGTAGRMFRSMAGLNGVALPSGARRLSMLPWHWMTRHGVRLEGFGFPGDGAAWIAALLAVAFLMPNVQQVTRAAHPSFEPVEEPQGLARRLVWKQNVWWAMIAGAALAISLISMSGKVSEFLYFQF